MSAFLCRDERETDFGVRRFRLNPGPQRKVLETAAGTFVAGFNAAIRARTAEDLAASLGDLGEPLRGHALEGAGMAATVLDLLTLRRGRRLKALLAGPGRGYPHLVYAGAGRAYASLRMRPSRLVRAVPAGRGTHPALRWLAWDGYGFHRAFFAADQVIGAQRVPRRLTAEQRSVFDQGVGRALWFHECADPDGVALRIAEFDPGRRASLWSGAGLAATYAGGADVADLGRLAIVAGRHRADLAHGSALACAAGTHAGLVPAHMATAAHAITGALAEEASGWVSGALSQFGQQAASPAGYQLWREEICARWAAYRGPAEAARPGAALAGFADLIEAADLADTADLAGPARPAGLTRARGAADAYIPPQHSGAPAQAGTAPAGPRPGAGRSAEHER
ncbi:MAG TPA: DUF1702 family protein [Streptosporangiaceae bacterium]